MGIDPPLGPGSAQYYDQVPAWLKTHISKSPGQAQGRSRHGNEAFRDRNQLFRSGGVLSSSWL